MLKNIYIAIACCLAMTCTVRAQEACVIKGTVANDSLRYDNKRIKKIYLSCIDEYDRTIKIDSTTLKKGRFEFRHSMKASDPVMLYLLTGFDNGDVPLFVEPGVVNVSIAKAAFPNGAKVWGTNTNDLYTEYKKIGDRCTQEQLDSLAAIKKRCDVETFMTSPEGNKEWQRIGAASLISCTADKLAFVLDHNDSPLAPLMMKHELYYMFDKLYAEKMLQALSPTLANHPYYRDYSNIVRAMDLKTGNELPNITLPMADGTKKTLEDFRGKFVVLDFWASWCGPCRKDIPNLVNLYNEAKKQNKDLTIISFSLDNKEKDWKAAIPSLGMDLPGWIHASDLLGWGSPAAKMMGVTAIPKAILIDPEGRAISFTLRGEELVRRVTRILNGDLYYQNEGEDKKPFNNIQ